MGSARSSNQALATWFSVLRVRLRAVVWAWAVVLAHCWIVLTYSVEPVLLCMAVPVQSSGPGPRTVGLSLGEETSELTCCRRRSTSPVWAWTRRVDPGRSRSSAA